MKVLVACEYSGVVRDAFIRQGHDAISCDLLPTDSPGPHYQKDIREVLQEDPDWDLMIAHPPCTYLAVSGMHWTTRGLRDKKLTEDALDFVKYLMSRPIKRIAIENPISIISTRIRKPDQIIHPYEYGEDVSKTTCLWLSNLPKLVPTTYIEPRIVITPSGKEAKRWGNQCDNYGQDRLPPSVDRWKLRSKTYLGIAEAFATQWGSLE
jgi:hypothetical protein